MIAKVPRRGEPAVPGERGANPPVSPTFTLSLDVSQGDCFTFSSQHPPEELMNRIPSMVFVLVHRGCFHMDKFLCTGHCSFQRRSIHSGNGALT